MAEKSYGSVSEELWVASIEAAEYCNRNGPLPPQDGGLRAWLFVAACFMMEGAVWGLAASFGVFQDYYRSQPEFHDSNSIAVIGTCAQGLSYLLSPLVIVILVAVPRLQRWLSSVGLVLMTLSLGLASLSSTVTHLVLSQGVGYGVGGCLLYMPSVFFLPDWFLERRGIAFGTIWAGGSIMGFVCPLITGELLDAYGWRTTLRIYAIGIFVIVAPCLIFHKPRAPLTDLTLREMSPTFHRSRTYLIYQISNIIEALGFFIPPMFIASHALDIVDSGRIFGSLTVTLYNIFAGMGAVCMGYVTDHHHPTKGIMISSFGAVVSVFVLWGLTTHVAALYVFAMAYGLFAGGYSSSWTGVAAEVQKDHPSANVSMVIAFMTMGRGIGSVVSGPISEQLLKLEGWDGQVLGGYGTKYAALIVFTGVTNLLGACCVFARWLKWI